jgi:hypothetical protein
MTSVWTDPDLAFLYREDVGLLAIADLVQSSVREANELAVPRKVRKRWRRIAVVAVAAIVCGIAAVPSRGLVQQAWELIHGAPVATQSLGDDDWRALSAMNSQGQSHGTMPAPDLAQLGFASIERLNTINGSAFYVARRTNGATCFGIGPESGLQPAGGTAARRDLFGRLDCPGGAAASFPSQEQPVLDMSVFHDRVGSNGEAPARAVWRLQGFAADPVSWIGVLASNGEIYDETAVVNNVYEYQATSDESETAAGIVGLDSSRNRVFTECFVAQCPQ